MRIAGRKTLTTSLLTDGQYVIACAGLIIAACSIQNCATAIDIKFSTQSDCGTTANLKLRQPRDGRNSSIWEDEDPEPRLINGKETVPGAWPWQVSLQLLHPKFGLIKHWCGAVLILPSWIVTAAHCIRNEAFSLQLAALWTAVLGEWDRDQEEYTEVRIPIDSIIVHDQFHNYQNDIALLKLTKDTSNEERFRSVCMPTTFEAKTLPYYCVATGWGKTNKKGSLSSKLRKIRVPLHNNSICDAKYGSSIPIQPSHLCGGKLDGNSGACLGDSGGPVCCKRDDGRYFVMGIISFGSSCGKPGFPDVYTKLSYYMPWIEKQINNHSRKEER